MDGVLVYGKKKDQEFKEEKEKEENLREQLVFRGWWEPYGNERRFQGGGGQRYREEA